jgi:two-component system, NarL family, nitrate/nitrite response regulator NarL
VTQPATIRVLVVDDHPLYRGALATAVRTRPGLELVGEAETGAQALEEIQRLEPDVTVLDARMPDGDGIGVLAAIERMSLGTRVVLVSGYVDSGLVYEAIAGGVGACFSKLAKASEICDGIVAVHAGETVIPPEMQSHIAEEIRRRAVTERPDLTQRETEILRLTSAGESAPVIAGRLGLSPGTVKSHLRHVYEKLGVSDRAAAVAEAMRRGILP